MGWFYKDIVNKILLSIGDGGATIVHIRGDHLYSRFFAKTPHEVDTTKLRNLIKEDPSAEIYIFLNNSDQTFEKKLFPIVNPLSIRKAAKTWMNMELSSYPLKLYELVSKNGIANSGEVGWTLTYCYSNPPTDLVKWVEMLGEYKNIIQGVYFLPFETGQFINVLTNNKGWNILVSESLGSGLRISLFYGDKIVSSKVLERYHESDLEFTAGVIEVEISNYLEYLAKFNFGKDAKIECHLILLDDLTSKIRLANFEKIVFNIATPSYIFSKIGFFETLPDRDRYFDSVILAYLSIYTSPKERLQITLTEEQYRFSSKVSLIRNILRFANVLGVLLSVYMLHSLSTKLVEFNTNSIYYNNLLNDISSTKNQIQEIEDKTPFDLTIEQINEIVDCHVFLSRSQFSPITILEVLNKSMANIPRAYNFEWAYQNSGLINIQQKKGLDLRYASNDVYKIKSKVDLALNSTGTQNQNIETMATNTVSSIATSLPQYAVQHTSQEDENIKYLEITIVNIDPDKKEGK